MRSVQPPRICRALLIQISGLLVVALLAAGEQQPTTPKKAPEPIRQKERPIPRPQRPRRVHMEVKTVVVKPPKLKVRKSRLKVLPPKVRRSVLLRPKARRRRSTNETRPVPRQQPGLVIRTARLRTARTQSRPSVPVKGLRPGEAAARKLTRTAATPRRIQAEQRRIRGIPLRIFVPRNPLDLDRHLHIGGGCLVVSRLRADAADVLAAFNVVDGQARLSGDQPCQGIPRLLGNALNSALGDPIGQTLARQAPGKPPSGALVLQVLLSHRLNHAAQEATRRMFGNLPAEEAARQARARGYELRCYAKTDGQFKCL